MSSLTVKRVDVDPSPGGAALAVFTRVAVDHAASILDRTGFFASLPPGTPLQLDTLDVGTTLFLDEIEANPEAAGQRAGAALAARIIAQHSKAPPPAAAPKGPIKCPVCGRNSGPAAKRCVYCAAVFTTVATTSGPRREDVIKAAFAEKRSATETGLAALDIDRQFAQQVLEERSLASTIAILELGTAVRAPKSDFDVGIAVEGKAENINIATIREALERAGFEANLGKFVSFIDLDEILAQARRGALSTSSVTKFLKAERLAGAPSADAKLLEIKRAIIGNPAYAKWLGQEVKGFASRASQPAGNELNYAFNLKDSPGAIRDIQYLSWLGAFFAKRAPGPVESFDGLVSSGLIVSAEAAALSDALVFYRECRRRQHLAGGTEQDQFVLAHQGPQGSTIARDGGEHAKRVRAILQKVGARL